MSGEKPVGHPMDEGKDVEEVLDDIQEIETYRLLGIIDDTTAQQWHEESVEELGPAVDRALNQ